jgi:hypothetical protein
MPEQPRDVSRSAAAPSGERPPAWLFVLLVVVAVVGIYASIYVPSFWEARTRHKINFQRGDMREIAHQLIQQSGATPSMLVATGQLRAETVVDRFSEEGAPIIFAYLDTSAGSEWVLISVGPNGSLDTLLETPLEPLIHDPTNGTVSRGDLIWTEHEGGLR